jgi:hypothetical protein
MNIPTIYESARGCGFRKSGGTYLRCDGAGWSCGVLPILLRVCPCCGGGVKPARGFTWINLDQLAIKITCNRDGGCGPCPLASAKIHRAGLLWCGEKFYARPEDFISEAKYMGVSRRIATVPKDFVIGETWVAIAHRKAVLYSSPGIFYIFKPDRIEYVVRGDETEQELERLMKRGLSPVRVEKQQAELVKIQEGRGEVRLC